MAKSGPLDEKLSRSLTQLQNIFSSVEKVVPKHLNPEYEHIFQRYATFFDKSSFSEKTLKNICEYLKREGIRLEYLEKEETKISIILERYSQVCTSFFFLDYIIPRFPSFNIAAHLLREILIRGISIIFYHARCLFNEGTIPTGQRLELYNIVVELKMLHKQHASEYDNFLYRVLTNTSELDEKELLTVRRNLLRSLTYTIDIEIEYATLSYLWGDFTSSLIALEAIVQPKKKVEEQYENIMALSPMDSGIARTTWLTTKKQIDQLTALFDKEIPGVSSRLYKAMLFVADLSDAFLLKLKALKSTPAWANSLVDEKVESLAASIKNECEYYSLPARYEGLAKCLSDKTLETLKKTVAKTCGDFKPLNAVDILKVIPSFMTLLATWRHFFGKEKATACYIIIDILDNLVNKAVVFKKEWSPKAQEMIAKLEQDRKEQEAQEKEKKKEKKERRKQRKNAAVLEKDNQEATHEEVSRLKIQLEESRARAEKMSKQLQVDDFVPTHLPFIATHHKIKLPQHVVKLLTTLNQKGYWAVVVGGAVRDDLLGIEAKDYDIITNCLKTELAKTTKTHCTENSYIPGLFHVSHEATEKKVEIYCITCPLMEALQNRDFTINTFIADRHGKVYDLLRVIEHLKAKSLTLLGDPSQRLSDDPKKLFRLFNLSSRLQREIASEYLAPLKIAAKYITKRLAFSVYLRKIESLFLEGRAYDNLQILDFCGIRGFMMPLPQKEFTIDLGGYEFYLACKLKEIDRKESQKPVSVCDILALLVLPWYLESIMPCTANGKSVEDVVDAFISAYEGSFLNTEKIALKNEMASLFRIYSAEYAEYQRSILALQERAYQKSDKYLQRSQISLLSSELPSPVTFSYPKALSAANETSIDKLRDSFKACTLETSDKRQNPQLC